MHNTRETDIGVKIIFSMHQLVWFMKLLSVISDLESWAGRGEPNPLRLINEDHAKLNLFSSLSVDKEPLEREALGKTVSASAQLWCSTLHVEF